MASFLSFDEDGKRQYVARYLGLIPSDPSSWPLDMIDAIIGEAEDAANKVVQQRARELMRQS